MRSETGLNNLLLASGIVLVVVSCSLVVFEVSSILFQETACHNNLKLFVARVGMMDDGSFSFLDLRFFPSVLLFSSYG